MCVRGLPRNGADGETPIRASEFSTERIFLHEIGRDILDTPSSHRHFPRLWEFKFGTSSHIKRKNDASPIAIPTATRVAPFARDRKGKAACGGDNFEMAKQGAPSIIRKKKSRKNTTRSLSSFSSLSLYLSPFLSMPCRKAIEQIFG